MAADSSNNNNSNNNNNGNNNNNKKAHKAGSENDTKRSITTADIDEKRTTYLDIIRQNTNYNRVIF